MLKPLFWMGSTLEDLRTCPDSVRQSVGYALELAQNGEKHERAKSLKGFKGAGVLEVVSDFDGDLHGVRSTPRKLRTRFMSCMYSKRNPNPG